MGLMKKLTSALVASSLVISLVATASAAYTPANAEKGAKRMEALKLLNGRPECGLCLNSEITRAELVTVIVRAFGKEEDAKLLKGSTIFPDIKNHWASGNIAMAVALVEKAGADPIGMPDGTFSPDAKLTPAQAVAFLMKFLGQKADPGKTWPNNFLDVAVTKGLITAEDKAIIGPMVNENATRGLVFYLFDNAFYSYPLADGSTFYTKYVDPVKPELNVTAPAKTTIDSKITISGKATGAAEVFVGTQKVTLAADGAFSAEVNLPELKEYSVLVTAKDIAGNSKEASFTVARVTGEAATIEAKLGTALLKAGAETELTVVVKDKAGNIIKDAAYDVEVTGDIGTFADGKFTAAAVPATGKLTVTSGNATPATVEVAVVAGELATIEVEPAAISLAVGQAQKFTAKGFDAAGNEVALTNVSWSASGGVMDAQGNFAATTSGPVTVTAKVGDVAGTAAVTPFAPAAKLGGNNVPDLVANTKDSVELMVNVLDANGAVVANSAANVTFTVSGGEVKVNDGQTATVAAVNGVAKVTVKSFNTTAGTGIITITSPGLTGINVSYKTVAQKVTTAKVDVTPSLIGNDGASQTSAVVKFYDQKGVAMTAPGDTSVKLTSSATDVAKFAGGAASVTVNAAASYTADVFAGNNLGSATISAEITAPEAIKTVAVTAATVSTGLVGAPYQLSIDPVTEKKSGETQSITVRVKDVNGNQITNPAYDTTVTLKVGDTTLVGTQADVTGAHTFSYVVGTAGTLTYTATADWTNPTPDVTLVKATQTASVIPGAAATVTAAFDATALNANGAHSSVLKATIKDAAGNVVKAGNYEVTFEKTTNNGATQTFAKTTVTSVEGVAQVTVTSGTLNGVTDTFTVSAKISSTTTLTNTASIASQVMGAPNKFGAVSQGTNSSLVVGKGLILQAPIQDGASTTVTTDNGRPFTVTAKNADAVVVGTYTGVVTNGIAKVTITDITKAAAGYTFEFTSEGLTKATSGALTLAADAVAGLTITPDLANLGNDGVTATTVSVKTADKFGNASNVTADTAVTIANSNPSLGTVTGLTADKVTVTNGTNSATFTFTAGTGLGSTTFTASATGLTTATANVNVVFVGAANKLSVGAIDNLTSGTNLVFKVDIQDAQGVRVTNAASVAGSVAVKIDGNDVAGESATQDRGQLTVTVPTAGINVAGAHTIEVTAGTLTKGTGSVTVVPGAYSQLALTATPASIVANGSATTAITVKFADAAGNPLADANGTATVSITTGNDFATLLTNSVGISAGQGSFAVQAKNIAGTAVITVKMTYKDVERTNTVNVSVVAGAPAVALSNVTKNTDTQLTILVRDANGNAVTNLVATDVTLNNGFTVTTLTHTGNGQYTVALGNGAVAAGTYTTTVTVLGVALAPTVSLTK